MVVKTWLTFDEVHDTGKTKVWDVYNAENGSKLGSVKWHGAWRQYVYDTSTANYGVVWNPDCMDELNEFIRARMTEWRDGKKRKNRSALGDSETRSAQQ